METFLCTKIESRPQMTFKACEARKRQCIEKDHAGTMNQFAECRDCRGWTDAPQYHIGDNTRHHKYPCKCCGASVWLTGDYCSFCRSQFAVANGHGISQAAAIPKIREYFANGGKRQKGGRGAKTRVQTLIDWKGEWEGMASPKITCWCCERENQFLKKKVDGHQVCGFCAKHLQNAISAGVHPDMAKEEIKVVAWNLNPGRWPEKDLWSWNKATDKKNLTVQEKPQSENVPEERSPPVKKLRAIYIPLATERDQKILDFIDELAMDHRQSRNQKILSILEDAMIRALDFGEGKAA